MALPGQNPQKSGGGLGLIGGIVAGRIVRKGGLFRNRRSRRGGGGAGHGGLCPLCSIFGALGRGFGLRQLVFQFGIVVVAGTQTKGQHYQGKPRGGAHGSLRQHAFSLSLRRPASQAGHRIRIAQNAYPEITVMPP